ncbi:MAG: P-type Cu+ transporter [Verrucomicrobiota bacterium]|jgi:Cu+-exporting ATPase
MQTLSPTRTDLAVEGMTCSGCARQVTEALQQVTGVADATVTLDARRASVRWNPGKAADVQGLVNAVTSAGYAATPIDPAVAERPSHAGHAAAWGINLLTGVIPTALLMLGEWVFQWQTSMAFRWISCALASVVLLGPGRQFFTGAWRQLRVGASNMDTLVALGSTTAYVFSLWVLLAGQAGHLYFMEAAAIITLISAGHWLEARVSSRASGSLRALMNLAPPMALRPQPDGTEHSVPVGDLIAGDVIVVKPGDRVPTDADVIEGSSAVNESMLTGESMPVEKMIGSRVYAGTLNESGRLSLRVSSLGEETALSRIIAAVQRAQNSRANIQRLGDRVASVFVPVVVLVAIAAALCWGFAPVQAAHIHDMLAPAWWHLHPPAGALTGAIYIAAAVLIVACPCAMGLATPAAIMAGSNTAARRGILIRDGIALEKAGGITAVLFDKTGTLTQGAPAVAAIEAFVEIGGMPVVDPSVLAAALARNSAHPLSRAVARLSDVSLLFDRWTEVRGAGVQADWKPLDGTETVVRLGSLNWLRQMGITTGAADAFVADWVGRGATILGLGVDEKLVAAFALVDSLKPGARAVIEDLARQGLPAMLVTGDNASTALHIAAQAGIAPENVFAEIRPEQKAALVQRLQEAGGRIAFVGDGINDAPALEQASLGIAVSAASDVARDAADIILLRSDIEAVPEAIGLARATMRTIRQNLFWAFFYNAAAIPLAALGFMSPVLCAAAMGLSDVVVIGNALRLLRWRWRSRGSTRHI